MFNRRRFLLSSAAAAAAALPGVSFARPASGAADAMLERAFDTFFNAALDDSPMLVTSLGLDAGARAAAKSKIDNGSLAAVARRKQLVSEKLSKMRAIDRNKLSPAAAISYEAALYDLAANDAGNKRFAYGGMGSPYVLSQLNGAYAGIPDFLDSQHTIATSADAEAYLLRLDGFAILMDQEIERVRHDVGLGVVPPDFAIDGALSQMKVLRQPAASSTLVSSLVTRTTAKGIAGDWQARASRIYDQRIIPALNRQIALLESLRPVLSVRCSPRCRSVFEDKAQLASACHSARAAERRCLNVWRSTMWRSRLKWLWTLAWTEANFCRVFIRRNRSIARSRRRKGRWLFSTRLLA